MDGLGAPQPGPDGVLTVAMPLGDALLPGIAAEDIGRCAYGVFRAGAEFLGKTVGIAGEHITGQRLATGLSRVYGEPVRYQPLPLECSAHCRSPVSTSRPTCSSTWPRPTTTTAGCGTCDWPGDSTRHCSASTRGSPAPGHRPGSDRSQLMEPHELILSVTNAGVAARCLHVVAELGVADHIDDRPVPAKELARLCAVDPDGLDRVLRLLAAHGVFSHASGGYQHSAASRLLRDDHPMSMRAFPQMMGLPVVLKSFDELAPSLAPGVRLVLL